MCQISIIVPVYNAAKYLSRTIVSIQAQTFEDWELLFVNDGSTDCSDEIIKQYAAGDARVKLINQKNSGPARARNVGMENAQGRYLSFVDSDDTIEPNMMQCMYDAATKHHAHIVMCNFATISGDKRIESHHGFTCNVILSDTQLERQVLMCYFNGKYSGVPSLWTKLVDKSWLLSKGITIPESRVRAEDWLFNLLCLESEPSFCAINDVLYNYWQNEGSIMHSVREGEWIQHFESMQILREVSQRHGFNYENNIATKYVGVLIEYMLKVYKQMPNRKDMVDDIINHPLYLKALYDADLSKLPKVFRIVSELQKRNFFKISKFFFIANVNIALTQLYYLRRMNVSNIHDCFGCGLCATVCARKVIEIQLNENGFYEPVFVNSDACTDCGLCVDVCSYQDDKLVLENTTIKSYGAWSKNADVRKKCSSGGVSFELGKLLLSMGYKVCGVKYDASKEIAVHYIAANEEELKETIGSKYIQSYTVDGLKSIDRKNRYLVIGSPCQIDSFRRYIRKFKIEDNFLLMDFFCHGVPSMLMWKKYIAGVKSKHGDVNQMAWRDKATGWHDSWSMVAYSKNKYQLYASRFSRGDAFYRLFLGDGCLGCACYNKCKFKYTNSSADIRIGDAWGSYYENNEEGVNAVISYTRKGDALLHDCNIELEPLPFDVVAESQMKKCPQRVSVYSDLMTSLRDSDKPLSDAVEIIDKYYVRQRTMHCINLLLHPLDTVKRIVRRVSMMIKK